MHYHYSKLYAIYKRGIIQVVVWSGVICTTTVQNYTLYTVYKRDIIQAVVYNRVSCTTMVQNCTLSTSATLHRWFFWSRVSCTTTVQNYTLSTSATLQRWLFGAVIFALPLFKTIHCLKVRHYTGGCLEPC